MEVGAEEEAAKNERDSVTSTVSPSTSPLHTQRPLADAKGQTHTRLDTLTLTLIPNDGRSAQTNCRRCPQRTHTSKHRNPRLYATFNAPKKATTTKKKKLKIIITLYHNIIS